MNSETRLAALEERIAANEEALKQMTKLLEVLVKGFESVAGMTQKHLVFMDQLAQSLAPLVQKGSQ